MVASQLAGHASRTRSHALRPRSARVAARQVARALDGARIDERQVRPSVRPVGDAPEHPLGFAWAARRKRGGGCQERLIAVSRCGPRIAPRQVRDWPVATTMSIRPPVRAHGAALRPRRTRRSRRSRLPLRCRRARPAAACRGRGSRTNRAASPSPSSNGRLATTVPPAAERRGSVRPQDRPTVCARGTSRSTITSRTPGRQLSCVSPSAHPCAAALVAGAWRAEGPCAG